MRTRAAIRTAAVVFLVGIQLAASLGGGLGASPARAATSFIDCGPETSTADPGQPVQIICDVYDDANHPLTGAHVDAEFLSGPNDPDAGAVPPPDVNNLLADELGQVGYSYTGTSGGTDTLCFWVDADGNDQNINESEPSCTESVSGGPDRVQVEWSGGGGGLAIDCAPETSTGAPGSEFIIDCLVVDDANQPVPGVSVAGEVLAGGASDNDGSAAPPDLGASTTDGSGVATLSYIGDQTGNDDVCLWIDQDGMPDNLNEGDKTCSEDDDTDVVTRTWVSSPTGAVDLAATILQTMPDAPVAGKNTELQLLVENEGADPSGSFDIRFQINDQTFSVIQQESLAPGESRWVAPELWKPAASKAYQITAWVDASDAISEQDENNNSVTIGVTPAPAIPRPVPADLRARSVVGGAAEDGLPVTFTALISNSGGRSAFFDVRFKVDDNVIGTKSVSLEGGGTTELISPVWTATAGAHVVKAIADPTNRIREANEKNNVATNRIVVRRRAPRAPAHITPDLQIKDVRSRSFPNSTHLLATACNVGALPITGAYVTFSMASRTAKSIVVADEVVGYLKTQECRTVTAVWRSGQGRYAITAEGFAYEADDNLDNNSARATIVVEAPRVHPPTHNRSAFAFEANDVREQQTGDGLEDPANRFIVRTTYDTSSGPFVEYTLPNGLVATPDINSRVADNGAVPAPDGVPDLRVTIIPVAPTDGTTDVREFTATIMKTNPLAPGMPNLRVEIMAKRQGNILITCSTQSAEFQYVGVQFPGDFSNVPVTYKMQLHVLTPSDGRIHLDHQQFEGTEASSRFPAVTIVGGTFSGPQDALTSAYRPPVLVAEQRCLAQEDSYTKAVASGAPRSMDINYIKDPHDTSPGSTGQMAAPYRHGTPYATLDYWASGRLADLDLSMRTAVAVGDDPHAYHDIHAHAVGVPSQVYATWTDDRLNPSFFVDTGARGLAFDRSANRLTSGPSDAIESLTVEASNTTLPENRESMHEGRREEVHVIAVEHGGPAGGTNTLALRAQNVRWFYERSRHVVDRTNASKTTDTTEIEAWANGLPPDAKAYGRIERDGFNAVVTAADLPPLIGFTSEQTSIDNRLKKQQYAVYGAPAGGHEVSAPSSDVNFVDPELHGCIGNLESGCAQGMKVDLSLGEDTATNGVITGGIRTILDFPDPGHGDVWVISPAGASDMNLKVANNQPLQEGEARRYSATGGFQTLNFTHIELPPGIHFSQSGNDIGLRAYEGSVSGEVFLSDTAPPADSSNPGEWGDSLLNDSALTNVVHAKLDRVGNESTLVGLKARASGLREMRLCTTPDRSNPSDPDQHNDPAGECPYFGYRQPNLVSASFDERRSLGVRIDSPRGQKMFQLTAGEAPTNMAAVWDSRPGVVISPRVSFTADGEMTDVDGTVLLPSFNGDNHLGDGVLSITDANLPAHADLSVVNTQEPASTYITRDFRHGDETISVLECTAASNTWTRTQIIIQATGRLTVGFVKLTNLENDAVEAPDWGTVRDPRADRWGSLQIQDFALIPGENGLGYLELVPCTENSDATFPTTVLSVYVRSGTARLHARKYLNFWTHKYDETNAPFRYDGAYGFACCERHLNDWYQSADIQMCGEEDVAEGFNGYFHLAPYLTWSASANSRTYSGFWQITSFWTQLSTVRWPGVAFRGCNLDDNPTAPA